MDKRVLGGQFRDRLGEIIRRAGLSQAGFAKRVGVDRSALSQILSGKSIRLPRAETLASISEAEGISLDWLLGLSNSEQLVAEMAPTLAIEQGAAGPDDSRLQAWRREAAGYKIRYAPAKLPDMLRTEEVTRWELGDESVRAEVSIADADRQIAYSRRPETDIEICMPMQRLAAFASGEDIWRGLDPEVRRAQVRHMVRLLEELYPTFRLFLYDGRRAFSAPYTVFGPLRAAIYIGDTYLVLNTTEHVRLLADHFDGLIRRAAINPHEAAAHVESLLVEVG